MSVGFPNADLPRVEFASLGGARELGDAEWLVDTDFFEAPPATAYELDAQPATFTVAGQDASLSLGRTFNAEAGAFTVTPPTVGGTRALSVNAESTAFALTGQPATTTVNRSLHAAAGTFITAGQAATLVATRVGVSGAGEFTLTGRPSTGTPARVLIAAPGSFAVTGASAELLILQPNRSINAEAGVFTLAGQAATLAKTSALSAAAGAVAVSGQPSTGALTRVLQATAGQITVSGVATLAVGRVLNAQKANADQTYVQPGYVEPGYVGSAPGVAIEYGYVQAGYVEPGYVSRQPSALMRVDRLLNAEVGQIILTGQAATFTVGKPPVSIPYEQAQKLMAMAHLHGLVAPLQVSATSRQTGSIVQAISGTETVTITTTAAEPLAWDASLIDDLAALHGIGAALTVTATSRASGSLVQTIATTGGTTTVTRTP